MILQKAESNQIDAPFHLSEECSNANVAAPRAIVMTSGFGGLAGWALQMVVAYTVIDIPSVIESDLGQPWAAYLIQVMPQKIALAILSLTIVCGFSMGQGCMVARHGYRSIHRQNNSSRRVHSKNFHKESQSQKSP